MSTTGGQGQPGLPQQGSAPYAPRYIGLGGQPAIVPDVPITIVFLIFYLIFAVIHIKIMKYNEHRGHKFIFNGALFGIAAQVFVYVGTIILYLCNWFFTQRVLRAQHPQFGWSTAYRIVHRGGMVVLILALLMIIVSSIQQFFTLDETILRVDRDLQLAGFTYFGLFTIAPLVLLAISFTVPRKNTEKFGAGRFRNAITILIVGSFVLAIGQCFRTIVGWLPEIRLRNAEGQPNAVPWYFSKACFYCFNFLTELLVVMFYAIMRVDLRFHVADGAKQPGDYRRFRESQFNINILGNEKRLKRGSGGSGSIRSAKSNETLHEYATSVFDDSRTLANSLRLQSSVMELDGKTGNWKIKRQSNDSVRSSLRPYNNSQSAFWDPTRANWVNENVPPVPSIPHEWPLRESQLYLDLPSKSPTRSSRVPSMEKGDAIGQTFKKLESSTSPPEYVAPLAPKKTHQPHPDIPRKQTYSPGSDIPRKHTYSPSSMITPKKDYTPRFPPSADVPFKNNCRPISSTTSGSYTTASSDPHSKENYTERPLPTLSPGRVPNSTNTEAADRETIRFSFETPPRNGSFEDNEHIKGLPRLS
ncbi:hypothetical protein N0V90_000537 [Kalmusia sp. IMI 367209]|nr:hypothetical protein N0V90_000537 [Kalmusia sp. IMI 367209]